MEALQSWFSQLQYEKLLDLAVTVAAALLCITVHEVSHGYAAYWLGDPTAKRAGRLTLNPVKHIDVVGLVCMALAKFGWAKPVPIDPRNFKHFRRDTAITALAGPVSNVLLSIVTMTLYSVAAWFLEYWKEPVWLSYVCQFLLYVTVLSTGLAVFNLIPIPPLDGSKVLFSLLPSKAYSWLLRYERFGFLLLLILLYTGVLDGFLLTLRGGLMEFIIRICWWPFDLLDHLIR